MRTQKGGQSREKRGFTLLEVAFALFIVAFLAVGVAGAMLGGLQAVGASTDRTVAIEIVTDRIEILRSSAISNFDLILPPVGTVGVIAIPVDSTTYPGSRLLGRAMVHVDIARVNTPVLNNPDLVEVTASISWRSQNNRLYGEDANLNGVLDPGEDLNGDGRLTSPVEITTRFSRR